MEAMKLDEILSSPTASWLIMERLVNDGSPSGYSSKSTSVTTRPSGGIDSFNLPFYSCHSLHLETVPPGMTSSPQLPTGAFPVHPDLDPVMEGGLTASDAKYATRQVRVSPTASGRTVAVMEGPQPGVHVKLHYPRLIGRYSRKLTTRAAAAALDTTRLLVDTRSQLPANLAFLPEAVALLAPSGVGAILRSPVPHPEHPPPYAIIPMFALFSRDQRRPHEATLLDQLIDTAPDPTEFVWARLLHPVLEGWAHLALTLGLLAEWNAQNLLVELDGAGRLGRVVFRDLQGNHRDPERRPTWARALDSSAYRVLGGDCEADRNQRSWLYDFKLGQYVFDPLIATAGRRGADPCALQERIREEFGRHLDIAQLEWREFFPADGSWCDQPPGESRPGAWIQRRTTVPRYRLLS
jgi:hypothetical protein